MSFKKPRVHLTGKSNADVRTISTTPNKVRIPVHERTIVQTSSSFTQSGENPIEASMQKYKTWNKKIRSVSSNNETRKENHTMNHDPPDYANVKHKVENLREIQDKTSREKSLQDEFIRILTFKGYNLKPQFIKSDKYRNGVVSFENFKEIMESKNLPVNLSKDSYKELYKELGGTSEGINYNNIISKIDLKDTPRLPALEIPSNTENRLKIIDKKTAPLNQLENIYTNALKIRKFFKSLYSSPSLLLKELSSSNTNNRISLQSLKDFVVSKITENKSIKVTKKELEGFLSSFDYNKDSDTGLSEVVKHIFLDDIVAANSLHIKKRAVPPVRNTSKLENFDVKRLKNLLVAIEEKMFVQGPAQSLSVFKNFDKDGDGYLTIEDIEQGLTLSQIEHTAEDSKNLMSFLDENCNGFVTFSEFSSKVQPNILTVNREKFNEDEEKHFNISQPSTKYHVFQQSKLQFWKPEEKQENKLKLSTRYSASPSHQNTFTNFTSKPDSALYISENERLDSKKFNPININHQDKEKLKRNKDARIHYLQQSREIQESRVKEIQEKERALDSQKMIKRALVKNNYEAKCKAGLMN